jgi:dTDP-4-dehydrorhamnose 3,5-epimerase
MSTRFDIAPTPIAGLHVLRRRPIGDARGFLERLFCREALRGLLPGGQVIEQINHTRTCGLGSVRGLHFQYPPHAETKFVTCLAGAVFDVALDLRQGSPTFLHWHSVILSANDQVTFVIPAGFAHGFQVLSESCDLLYLHSAAYAPQAEGGLHPQDPRLGIAWPLPIAQLSARDAAHPFIGAGFAGVCV